MNERDYLRLKRRFEKEYKEKLRALELIWQEASGGKKAPRPPKGSADSNGETVSIGNAAAAVAEFVQQFKGGEFSAKQVDAWITKNKGARANRTTIIHKLRRMVNEVELVLVSQGSGKRGSLYRIPESISSSNPPPTPAPPPSPSPSIEPPPDVLATIDEINELRELIRAKGIVLSQFRADVLESEFRVHRASELTHDQIQGLILRYAPGPPPADGIPF